MQKSTHWGFTVWDFCSLMKEERKGRNDDRNDCGDLLRQLL